MPVKAVLFDLDGVLIDTEGIYTEFWDKIDQRYHTGIENFALVIKGSTLATILDTHFPDFEIQSEICKELRDFEDNMPFRLFEGVDTLLNLLHTSGYATAIVTSSNRKKMDRVFKELPVLAENIDTLITDEDVTESKPHPQGYLKAAERLCALPDSFVVVEDSLAGLEAGRRAGGRVVAIATTNPRSRIESLADITLDSTTDLWNYICKLD